MNDDGNIRPDGVIDLNHLRIYTSDLRDFSHMFSTTYEMFDVSNWDVSKGINFDHMFAGCRNFDCDLSKWDVSNANSMISMFEVCTSFVGTGLENWDVSNVESFRGMFNSATSFDNIYISNWDISSAIDLDWMFYNAEDFWYAIDTLEDKWNLKGIQEAGGYLSYRNFSNHALNRNKQ